MYFIILLYPEIPVLALLNFHFSIYPYMDKSDGDNTFENVYDMLNIMTPESKKVNIFKYLVMKLTPLFIILALLCYRTKNNIYYITGIGN